MLKAKDVLPIAIGVTSIVAVWLSSITAVAVLFVFACLYVFDRVQQSRANRREIDKLAARVAALEAGSVSKEQIKDISQWVAGQKLTRK